MSAIYGYRKQKISLGEEERRKLIARIEEVGGFRKAAPLFDVSFTTIRRAVMGEPLAGSTVYLINEGLKKAASKIRFSFCHPVLESDCDQGEDYLNERLAVYVGEIKRYIIETAKTLQADGCELSETRAHKSKYKLIVKNSGNSKTRRVLHFELTDEEFCKFNYVAVFYKWSLDELISDVLQMCFESALQRMENNRNPAPVQSQNTNYGWNNARAY